VLSFALPLKTGLVAGLVAVEEAVLFSSSAGSLAPLAAAPKLYCIELLALLCCYSWVMTCPVVAAAAESRSGKS